MKRLTEADIIATMLEVWDKRVNKLINEIDVFADVPDDIVGKKRSEKLIITPGLKVRRKKEPKYEYTVKAVGPDKKMGLPDGQIALQAGEKLFSVTFDRFESEFDPPTSPDDDEKADDDDKDRDQ